MSAIEIILSNSQVSGLIDVCSCESVSVGRLLDRMSKASNKKLRSLY